MRFLVDNALSYRVAQMLRIAEHDAVHVRDIQLGEASDQTILEYALYEDRVIISTDTDFGILLAKRNVNKPSFILLRWAGLRQAEEQVRVILANLPNVRDALDLGAVIVIEPSRIRVRSLPIEKL